MNDEFESKLLWPDLKETLLPRHHAQRVTGENHQDLSVRNVAAQDES